MGIRLGVASFWAAPSAPKSAQSAFTTRRGALLMDLEQRGLNLGQTRRIAIEAFKGDTEHLFVAPRAGGGFCYEWATEPGDPGIWVDELGGCGDHSKPLNLGYDDTRISIVVNRALADRVRVTLTNGRVVQPRLHWVSDPINAGFVLYQPPSSLHVLYVVAFARNRVVETDSINQIFPTR